MMTADVSQWDETTCGMVTCRHPQCWDTLKRTEEEHPWICLGNPDSIFRAFLEREGKVLVKF